MPCKSECENAAKDKINFRKTRQPNIEGCERIDQVQTFYNTLQWKKIATGQDSFMSNIPKQKR